MQLHLVLGPTGVGKTERSVALARQHGCPVLALSRFEVFYELPTGCGRPTSQQLQGTVRLYPQERPISAGELPAAEAEALVRAQVAQLAGEQRSLILEGGSIALCQALHHSGWWNEHDLSVTQVAEPAPVAYRDRLRRRIVSAMSPGGAHSSLLDELVTAANFPAQLGFVEGIMSYQPIARWCRQRDLSYAAARDALRDQAAPEEIVDALVDLCASYAGQQQATFAWIAEGLRQHRSLQRWRVA